MRAITQKICDFLIFLAKALNSWTRSDGFVGLTAPWAVDLRSIEELHTALDAGVETWKPNCTGL